ncbi:MAG TPA: hypothetical protein VKB35_05895 [Ktedonobacteraceae bacterium]|nr:hypothetical protein [Ktedonobacteraceae bacterium]
MPDRPNILILTALTGSGHLSLAEALRDLLEQEFAITIVNLLPSLFEVGYRFVGHYALWLWSMAFHLSDSSGQARSAQRLFVPLIDSRLKRALDGVQPDLVITTHPLLSHAARRVLEHYAPRTPFVMLLSDPYSIHATWFSERNAAATLAPTRESRELALANGFDPSHVHLGGWPVRGQFYRTGGLSRAETLTRLGLDPDRFTIFLQGGGDGATNFWRSTERLLALDRRVQVILATGMNRVLLRRFSGMKSLYALPFTREIAQYMSAADIVMGLAIDATSRLWLAGVVSRRRDRALADRLLHQVRACCPSKRALLVCTDGWAAYPKSIMRAFRDKVKKTVGRGRACLEVWPELCIATVIKRTEKKRVVEVTRKVTLGTPGFAHP